mmetsp:Transcript_22763/g.63688  ORF Transcript_22763/g.63688 Transcript_22763/m.63688 type:complete len:407 (+) Transcript_22763:85-1305(+)
MSFNGTGASAVTVMRLNSVPLAEPGSPAPPLQRPSHSLLRAPEVVREADCILSHLTQLQEKERQRRREKRASWQEVKAERNALRAALKAEHEAQEERRRFEKNRSQDLLEHQKDHRMRALVEHMELHKPDTYWPFEKRRPGPPILTPGEYRSDLNHHLQAQQQARNAVLALNNEPPKGKAILEDRIANAPSYVSKGEKERALNLRRQHVLRQAELRRQVAAERDTPPGTFGDNLHGSYQRATFQKMLREQQQRLELKSILEKQQVEKRARDLAEHRELFGNHKGGEVLTAKHEARMIARNEQVEQYKRDLKAQIRAQKTERRRLKEALNLSKSKHTARAIVQEHVHHEKERMHGLDALMALPTQWDVQRQELEEARLADKIVAVAPRMTVATVLPGMPSRTDMGSI